MADTDVVDGEAGAMVTQLDHSRGVREIVELVALGHFDHDLACGDSRRQHRAPQRFNEAGAQQVLGHHPVRVELRRGWD